MLTNGSKLHSGTSVSLPRSSKDPLTYVVAIMEELCQGHFPARNAGWVLLSLKGNTDVHAALALNNDLGHRWSMDGGSKSISAPRAPAPALRPRHQSCRADAPSSRPLTESEEAMSRCNLCAAYKRTPSSVHIASGSRILHPSDAVRGLL